MKRNHWFVCIASIVFIAALVIATRPLGALSQLSDRGEVEAAWKRANSLGAYRYTTELVQTTWPLPNLENAGLSSQTERMYIEGQADRRADTLQMALWAGEGRAGSRDGAIELRVAEGKTQGRVGQAEWKDLDDLSHAFAPGNDPLGYLAGVQDVVKQGSETRELNPADGAQVTFSRYSFKLNGPAFAAYMRDQLENELVRKGELPPGIKLDTARVYVDMTGEGEIWLDSRGLPLRQVIHAEFPPYGKEKVEIAITTDFSGWLDTPGAALGVSGLDPRQLELPGSDELITYSLLALVLGLAGWGLFHPSRVRYGLVCGLVIVSMLLTPMLQSRQVYAFSVRQAQSQATSERERETAKAQKEMQDELNAKDWNPQHDPLAISDVRSRTADNPPSAIRHSPSILASASASTSSNLCDELVSDDGTDSDLDGLTDVEEGCIGTDPALADTDGDGLKDSTEVFDLGTDPNGPDSDGDGINDGAEVRGFVDDQAKHWYLNPLDVDSNGDQIIDRLEAPVSESGELACGLTNPDGSARCSNSQIDTDLDGTPDAFDFDDDNDGVPDQVDTARTRLVSQISITMTNKLVGLANQAFTFEMNNLKLDTPVFADFQLRPVNPKHLWYSLNVLDWPSGDTEGQIQRVHDTTFGSSGQDANGDMRLIPMLEIVIPYKEGHYGNLPILPGAPPITASTPVTAWLDARQTDMFNITVRKFNEAGDLAAYVPLALVKDPVGESPVAFSARMAYWPSVAASGQTGVADGGPAQTARLIWAIQAKNDVCRSVPEDYEPHLEDEDRFADWCEDISHWDEMTTIVHSYYDDWYLTGFELREDRGLKTAVVYEQPDYALSHGYNAASYYESYLWALANDLDETFIAARGRDTDGDGYGDVRDLTLEDIWTRFHTGSTANETERWGIPADALQVVTHSFPHQGYLPTLPMTITPQILNSAFMNGSQPKIANPTLLFAREERFRLISLNDNSQVVQYTASPYKGILQTSKIKVNMAKDLVAENVLASLSWAPFAYDSEAQKWKSDPVDEYAVKLRARLGLVFQAAGGWGQDADAVTGAGLIATSFYLGMYTGLNRAVELDGTPLTFDYACQDEDVSFKAAAGAGAAAKAVVEEITAHVAIADHSNWWTFGRQLLDTKALKAVFGADAAKAQLEFLQALGQNNAKGYGGGMATLKNLLLHGFGPIKGDSLAWRVVRGTGLGIAAAAIGLAAMLYATTTLLSLAGIHVPGEEYICQSIMAALMVGLAAKSLMAIKDIVPLIARNGLSSTIASVTKTFQAASRAAVVTAVIALIVTAVVAIGMFLVTVIAGKIAFGSLAFDQALAAAVATIIVAAWMLAIGLIPIAGPIIVAIIGAIDALIILACTVVEKTAKPNGLGWDIVKNYVCGGITGLLTKGVELLIYDQTPLVDLQAPNRVIPTNFSLKLVDPARGFMVGNRLTVKADIITTLYRNAPFEPEKMQREIEDLVEHGKFSTLQDLIDNFGPGILYIWQFADLFLKEAAFRYKITPDKDDKKSVDIRDMWDEWDKVAQNPLDQRRYKATQRAGETGNVKFTQAGINWSPPLHLVESYATLVQECVSDPLMVRFTIIPPSLCWLRDKEDSMDISLGDNFKFDVFPASLDEFYTLADPDGDGGYTLAWDERFPALADADGDGLRSRASGGNDPDDAYTDTDGDGLSDYYELQHALPALANDADSDGLNDYDEMRYNTRSQLSDSDGDGLSDKEEVDGWDFVYAFDANDQPLYTHVTSDPTDPDTDSDGLTDKLEQVYHFNPRVYSLPNVLEMSSDIDDADGIVAPGQAIVYTATVENKLRDIYALGLLELEFPASQDPHPEPLVYSLAPRQAMTVTNQTVVNSSISASGPVSLTQRAGAMMTDLRGEAGNRALWLKLDESTGATSFTDSSLHGNDGTCSGASCPTAGASGYIGKAVQFDGIDDAISIPRPIADDFTIAFWLKSDQWVGYDNQWWYGMGLVDGNVAGEANDFGVSLGNGRVLFGVGNPDTTIKSEFVADGEWHHVAATRDKESGIIRLYVDGLLVAYTHASTASLTSPPSLRIGSLQTGANFFAGLIDDVQIYPTTLDANQVMALYSQPIFKLSLDTLECTTSSGLTTCSTQDEAGGVQTHAVCLGSQCPESVPGARKRGVQLNGVPLSVPDTSALKLSKGEFSQSVWIKPTDSTTTGRQGVWGYSPEWDSPGNYRGAPSDDAYPSIFITGTTGLEVGFGDGSNWRGCVFPDLLSLNAWNHVVATYDYNAATSGGSYKVYVNGQLQGTCGLSGKPTGTDNFDIGRATHCAQVENPRVYCINEPGDAGDHAEFYGYFDDDGYDHRWWGVIEDVDTGETFYTNADPHDYCGGTKLKVYEYDDSGGDDFIGSYTFDYSQPTNALFAHVIEEPGGDGKLRLYLSHTNPSVPFVGAMDELALYRRALSEDEVQALYLAAERVFEIDLDETPGRAEFADATANGYTATCNPQATCPASGLPGRFNQAARFDGIDDSLSLNTPDGITGGTLAAWVQRTPGGNATYKPIISYKESGGCGFGLGLDNNGVPQAQIWTLPSMAATVKDSTPAPEYAWVHLAAIYDGVMIYLYRDGELVGNTPALNASMACAGQTTIGSGTALSQGTGYFKGYLDQVVMFGRALTAEQVRWLKEEAPVTSLHLDEALYEPLGTTPTSHFDNAAQPGDAYDATCTACPAAGQKGWMRQATVFDGTQYLTKPDNNITLRDGFSVGGWFKLSKELTTTNQILAGKGSFSLFIPGRSETVTRTLVYFGTEGTDPSQALKPLPDYPGLMLNQWTHILATYSTDNHYATLYVNGNKVGIGDLPPAAYDASPLLIGQNLVGQTDEVVVYNYVLGARAIKHIYEYQVHWYDTAVSHNITVDADNPVISLDLPSYITNRDMVLAAIVSDATSAVTGVEYRLDGGGWQTPIQDYAAWVWTFNPDHNLAEGAHTLELRATDSVGHVGHLTKPFNVDSTGPAINLDAALTGAEVVLDTSHPLSLYGSVTDSGSGVGKVFITLLDSLGRAVSSPQLATVSGNTWQIIYTATVPLNGLYTVQMDAADRLGNLSTNTLRGMTAFGARARSTQAVTAQSPVQLDGQAPVADVYRVAAGSWALSGTLASGLPTISGTFSTLPYPTGQILAMHLEEPSGATRFQDTAAGHALGTCTAGACPQAGQSGRFGLALSLDGGDSINLGPNRRLGELAGAGSFSLLAWVNPSDTAGQQHFLDASQVISPNTGLDWYLLDGQQRLELYGVKTFTSAGPALPAGQWTHLAAVMAPLAEGGVAVTFYINGQVMQTITSTLAGQPNPVDDWLIGEGLKGQLDELVVYDRPLNADQILALARPAPTNVYTLEVGLLHLKDWGNPNTIQWQPATLYPANQTFSTWSYQVPAQTEGAHQLYLRATDRLSHTLTLPNVWQGEVDSGAPEAILTHIAPRFPGDLDFYRCLAWDYNLSAEGYTCPVPGTVSTFHSEPWFTAVFSYSKLYTYTSPLAGTLYASPDDQLVACDGMGQCTTVVRDTTTLAWPLGVVIVTPTASVVISTPATPLAIAGAAYAQNDLQNLHVILGIQDIYATSWPGGIQQATWNTTYTPTQEGVYPLWASLSDWAGAVISSAAPVGDLAGPLSKVYVDFTPPAVSLSTERINSANFDRGIIKVSGLVSEATWLDSLTVRLDDGGWQDAIYSQTWPLSSQPWTANLYSALTAPPEGRSYTLTVRATDIAGRVAETSRVVPADAVPPDPPITMTLTYSGGQAITPGMTIADVLSPNLNLEWSSSTSPDLAGYTVEWFNDPQQLTPAHVQQAETLPLTATQASFTAGQQYKLWARLSSMDTFDNPGVKQLGPVYVDDELTPVYVDMGEGETGGQPYCGWLQAECNQLGQDNRIAGRVLPSGAGQPQAFYAAWDRDGLRMTWGGADWRTDGNLFVYLDTQEGGSTLAYDPFGKYGDDVYLPTYRVQTTTYRMAADWAIHVQFNPTAPFSTSVQLRHYTGSNWTAVPAPGLKYTFDAGQSPAVTDLYVPFTDLGITHPVSQSLGLAAFATQPDILRLWAVMPSSNKVNSQWATGNPPINQPWGLNQRYYWPSVGDGVCPRDGESTTDLHVSLEAGALGLGYSLLGNGLPISVSEHLAGLTGWGSIQNPACFATPNAPGCTPQIDTSTPVSVNIRPLLAYLNDLNAPAVGNGQPVSVTVRLENTGKTAIGGVHLRAQSWGHLRLTGITQTLPITLPAGSWITRTLTGVIDTAHDAANDHGWATLGIVVLDKDTIYSPPARYIYPQEWLYVDYEVDQTGPEYIDITSPDPAVGLIGLGETVFQGMVYDQSSAPTVTVQIETHHLQSGYPPLITNTLTFTCVDPTPADRQWACPVTIEQLNDYDRVYVRARATDVYGQTSGWFARGNLVVNNKPTQVYLVDAISPTLSLSSETQAALSDGWIGPNEMLWSGAAGDNRLLEALDVCDSASGDCTRISNLVPPDQLPFKVNITDNVAEGTPAWIPRCDLGARGIFHRISSSNLIWDVGFGLVISHPNRSDLRIELTYGSSPQPNYLSSLLAAPGTGSSLVQNYNVTFDDAAAVPLWKDGADHTTLPPDYEAVRRPAGSLSVFGTGSYATDTWYLSMCDTQGHNRGMYLRSRLTVKYYASGYQRATAGEWRYSLPVASLDGVTQTRTLVVIDSVGLRGPTTTLTYRLDNVAPVLTVTHALTDVNLLYLSGSVSDGGGVRLMRARMTLPDGGQYATVISNTAGAWLYHAAPSPFQAGNYRVWVEAEDWAGNLSYAGPFNLSLPPQPNRIEQVIPADGATNVARNQPIVMDFSQAMKTDTLNLVISPTVLLTPTWNAEHMRVNLSHPYLAPNTAYHVEVLAGANQDNQSLEDLPYTWVFTTGETIAEEADMSVSLARNGTGDVLAGDLITYTATVTNAGPTSVTSALLTFNFGPADTVAWAGGPGCQWSSGTEVMTCTMGLSGFTPANLTVSARTVNWSGVFRSQVSVEPPAGIVDPNALNNIDGPVVVVVNWKHSIYLPLIMKKD